MLLALFLFSLLIFSYFPSPARTPPGPTPFSLIHHPFIANMTIFPVAFNEYHGQLLCHHISKSFHLAYKLSKKSGHLFDCLRLRARKIGFFFYS
jgi:hypothetical protein